MICHLKILIIPFICEALNQALLCIWAHLFY